MTDLITPEELPRWVPGEITARSDGLGWRGVALRGYRYLGQDVYIPPMRDYMVVSYQYGATPMERRFDGSWTHTRCAPGSISLLTRAQRSDWNWSQNVEVCHVYLTGELLNKLASEALDRSVEEVHLRDLLNVDDPLITATVHAIRGEAAQQAVGGALYVEALATQLGLHLLRRYSSVTFRASNDGSGLGQLQRQRVVDYIESQLSRPLDLDQLAAVAGL
ncbi:MAG: AraC family transcriptional regulator, partial [Gammaproteobacteria bacterium]